MSTHNPYELFTREEVADRLRIHLSHVTALTAAGELHHLRIGRRVLVPRYALEAFIRGEKITPGSGWPPTPSMFNDTGDAADDAKPVSRNRSRKEEG